MSTKTHCSQVFSVFFSKQEYLFSRSMFYGWYHTNALDLIGILFLLCSWQYQSRASNCLWRKIPTTLVLSLRARVYTLSSLPFAKYVPLKPPNNLANNNGSSEEGQFTGHCLNCCLQRQEDHQWGTDPADPAPQIQTFSNRSTRGPLPRWLLPSK